MTPDCFLQITDALPDGYLLVSGEGGILAANRRAAALAGADPVALSGVELSHIADIAGGELGQFLRLCSRSREPVPSAVIFHGRPGRTRVSGTLLRPRAGRDPALILLRFHKRDPASRFVTLTEKIDQLNRQIEQRKAVEAELREEHNLASLGHAVSLVLTRELELRPMLQRCAEIVVERLEAALVRIWAVDADDLTLELQASAGMYTHLDGRHGRVKIGQYKIGQIAQECRPYSTNAVRSDPRIHDQEWVKRERLVSFAGYPLVVSGRPIGVVATFARHALSDRTLAAMAAVATDIALGVRRVSSEQTLKQHVEALRLADRRKDEFLAMLGHELRNPLAPIRSGLELLQIDPDNREVLAVMRQQVQHVVRLVDELLDVSRITQGKIQLHRETVDLNEILARVLAELRPTFDRKRHQLSVTRAEPAPWVDADPVRLTQVVCNLLHNASKYTPPRGRIWLETAREGDRAVIRVRDNGIGIERDFLADVYTLFSQSAPSLDRSEGGLGLGLTIAKKIVELHGGQIEAASEGRNRGSQFTVCLPLARAPAGRRNTGQAAAAPTGWAPGLRVLIVDDNGPAAQTMVRLLKAIGLENVETASDGRAALAAAEAFGPRLVFLDIGLPDIDGFEVARRLRARQDATELTLVAITGYGGKQERDISREAGFDLHLVKPVGLDQLKTVLAGVSRGA